MKNTTIIALCVLGASTLVYGATELAKINGTTLTLEDFNRRYQENLKFFQYKTPSKKGVLEDLIKRELGIQEAKKLGLDKDPEVIDRMQTVLYHALLDKKLSKDFEKIQISDDEAKSYYAKNPEIRTSHIFVGIPPNASAADLKRAQDKIKELQGKLKEGKMSFAEIAQRFSEGVAAPMGGDIDYQTREKLDPVYYETALKLRTPGKVSDIVRSQFGLHIIKLTALRPWEEVDRGMVKRMIFDEKRTQVFEKYMSDLRKQSKVTVHNDLIKE